MVILLQFRPSALVKFPNGEISIEEKDDGEEEQPKKTFSVNGVFKTHVLDGICTANYRDENLSLRYSYKVFSFYFFPISIIEDISCIAYLCCMAGFYFQFVSLFLILPF